MLFYNVWKSERSSLLFYLANSWLIISLQPDLSLSMHAASFKNSVMSFTMSKCMGAPADFDLRLHLPAASLGFPSKTVADFGLDELPKK